MSCANPLGLTAEDWKKLNGAGIRLFDQSGVKIPDEEIQLEIDSATRWFEQRIGVRFYCKDEFPNGIRFKTPEAGDVEGVDYDEEIDAQDFDINFFTEARYMHMTMDYGPILGVDRITLAYPHRVVSFEIPADWIVKRGQEKTIQIVPGVGGFGPGYVITPAALPGTLTLGSVPQSVSITYRGGLEKDKVRAKYPQIIEIINKQAAVEILNAAQNLTDPGVSGRNVSIDGVSQGTQLTQSAVYGLYSASIDRYDKSVKQGIKDFDQFWNGIKMAVIA